MNNLCRTLSAVARVSRTRYPGFIFGLPLARGAIPVFTYHDVEPAEFSRDLEFLATNGYRTLCLEEYLAARSRGRRQERAVLLTFDDARKSFLTVALPLLRTFKARAVLFVPTYWMKPPSQPVDDLFMSWQDVRACAESGIVDVESHAHRHALVAVASQLMDFAHPQARERFDIYDWPMRGVGEGEELGRPALGTPVYRAAPLLSATRRFVENPEVMHACRVLVERNGGEAFFTQSRWREELDELHRQLSERMQGQFMQEQAFRALVESEFELSREEFRTHLGRAPTAIAYPWMLGSALSLELAKRHGLRSAFGAALDYRAERRSSDLPLAVFGRFKCDWLQLLPGRQRSNLWKAAGRKLSNLPKQQHLAH